MDDATFNATAPQWNCVDYPGEGMHYVNKEGCCNWCGKSKEEIARERADEDQKDD